MRLQIKARPNPFSQVYSEELTWPHASVETINQFKSQAIEKRKSIWPQPPFSKKWFRIKLRKWKVTTKLCQDARFVWKISTRLTDGMISNFLQRLPRRQLRWVLLTHFSKFLLNLSNLLLKFIKRFLKAQIVRSARRLCAKNAFQHVLHVTEMYAHAAQRLFTTWRKTQMYAMSVINFSSLIRLHLSFLSSIVQDFQVLSFLLLFSLASSILKTQLDIAQNTD